MLRGDTASGCRRQHAHPAHIVVNARQHFVIGQIEQKLQDIAARKPARFAQLMRELRPVAEAVGRGL